MRRAASTLLLLLCVACVSEDGEDDEGGGDDAAATDECISGLEWVGGNRESSRMHPGGDCLGCHQSIGEAEEVVLAGTVYEGLDERDDCFGLQGVTVQITDSTDQVFELITNSAGNFLLEEEDGPIIPPYSAKLIYEGRERAMTYMPSVTSCNSCHGEVGMSGAPGRLLVP